MVATSKTTVMPIPAILPREEPRNTSRNVNTTEKSTFRNPPRDAVRINIHIVDNEVAIRRHVVRAERRMMKIAAIYGMVIAVAIPRKFHPRKPTFAPYMRSPTQRDFEG